MKNNEKLEQMKIAFKEGRNIFLTGAAGTGKSYILKEFIKWARKYSKENSLGKVAVTGSTGAAAINVGGGTIHSFFGIGITKDVDELSTKLVNDEGFSISYKRKLKKIKEYNSIIIDEISMVGKNLLEMIDTTLSNSTNRMSVFGGKQLIVVGDFFQLPPVKDDYAFKSDIWKQANFEPIILTDVIRQTDTLFMNILKRIRIGNGLVNQEVHDYIDKLTQNNISDASTKLFAKNDDVESLNIDSLSKLDGDSFEWKGKTEGKEQDVERLKKNILAPEIFKGKIGAKVMLLKNDPEGKYVNGSLGFITDNDGKTISVALESNNETIEVKTATWELFDVDGEEIAKFSQVPLRLAYAITIHKSQGLTIDGELLVDLKGCYSMGQAYVALSRVTDPKKLKVKNYSNSTIRSSSEVFNFYQEIAHQTNGSSSIQNKDVDDSVESTTTNPLINHPLVDETKTNELKFWNPNLTLLSSFIPKGQNNVIRFFRGKPKNYPNILKVGNIEEVIESNKESSFTKDGYELKGYSIHENIGQHLLKIPSRSVISEIREPFVVLPWDQVLVDDSIEYGSKIDDNLKNTLTIKDSNEIEETKLTLDYIKEKTPFKWTHRSQMVCHNDAIVYGEIDDILYDSIEDKYYVTDLKTSSSADKKSYWYQLAIYIQILKSLNPQIAHKISNTALIKWTRIKTEKRIVHPNFNDKNENGEFMNIAKNYEYNKWIIEESNSSQEAKTKAQDVISSIENEILSRWEGRDNSPTPNHGIYFMKWQQNKEPIDKIIVNELLEKDLDSSGYLSLAEEDINFFAKWNIKTVEDYKEILETNNKFKEESQKLQTSYNNLK